MRFVSFSVCTAAMVAATPALPCEPVVHFEPAEQASTGYSVFRPSAPVGGVWWVERRDGRVVDDVDALSLVDEEGSRIALTEVLVTAGPGSIGLRVPVSAAVGQRFTLEGPNGAVSLDVIAGEAPGGDTPSPEIAELRAESTSEVWSPECGLGFQELQQRHFTDVHALLLGPVLTNDDVLVDAWILESGSPLPNEDAQRALDKMPAVGTALTTPDGEVAFRVSRVGTWDVHVRVTDARTGLSSETVSTRVDNAPSEFAGYGPFSFGCSATGGHASQTPLPLLVLIGLRRQGRRAARAS
jgi:hypothetical protein